MTTFGWVLTSGLAMSAIALVGSLTLVLRERTLQRLLLPLVALAAGALLGGALFHMLPEAIAVLGAEMPLFVAFMAGFVAFYLLEQYLHWHHCHRMPCAHEPVGYLILAADALHNRLYAEALATVMMGSWPEPFGLVAIESLASGTPVIARAVGALPEIIEPGVTGFVVNNLLEATAAVERVHILDRRQIRREALRRFSVEHMADRYLTVYRSLLNPETQAPSAESTATQS